MKIDWLIDAKELENTGVDHKSVTMDDVSIRLFRDNLFFSTTQPQNQDILFYSDIYQSLAPCEQDELIQNTTITFAQSSPSIRGYSIPLVLS